MVLAACPVFLCPGTVRHRSLPAPPRPGRPASQRAGAVGPGARTPGSAVPRPIRTGFGPAPRRSQALSSWCSATKPRLLRWAQPSPALVKAQCAGAEPRSAAAGGLAPYCACAGLGGGTFWLVWLVAVRFLVFSLDVPTLVAFARTVSWCCPRRLIPPLQSKQLGRRGLTVSAEPFLPAQGS